MADTTLKIGCQTFTWEMLGHQWSGTPDELLSHIAAAGYEGIEITDTMIGHYAGRPNDFSEALQRHRLQLVAFAFGSNSGFTVEDALAADLEQTERWIAFARNFPDALVSIGSATVVSEGPREEKFDIAARFYNLAAALGMEAGVQVAIHPSSHHNTLLLTREDYDRLFALLDAGSVGWVPDTGHMLRGGHNLADTLQAYRDRIRYLHLKDVDSAGDWAMLGSGVLDTALVIDLCRQAPRFNQWVVVEEESATAGADPAAAVRTNREYLASLFTQAG